LFGIIIGNYLNDPGGKIMESEQNKNQGFQCPHCKAWHPNGTTYCPIFGLPISPASNPAETIPPPLPANQNPPVPWKPPEHPIKKNPLGLILSISGAVIILIFILMIWPFKVIRLSAFAPTSTKYPTPTHAYPTQAPLATKVPSSGSEPPGKGIVLAKMPEIMDPQTTLNDINSISDLQSLATEQYDNPAYAGNTYPFTVSIQQSEPVLFGWGWCAADQTTLDENLAHIKYSFSMNNSPLSTRQMAVNTWSDSESACEWNGFGLHKWSIGEYHLEIKVEYTRAINDGWGDYSTGVFWHDYTVYVGK
jgi:hypothetical protein